MYKIIIKTNGGFETEIKARSKRVIRHEMQPFIEPTRNIKSAIFYTYPLKNNEPLVLIEDGQIINEL